ncbi:Major Facilitator Superfamily (MFS) [Thraustotheca clavata]|uniref:Major Facilitator Superfamily (MFS) n=1 Tax=Thraustotheca clavata TaxID=74557 RepID=A0A1W0A8F8_9STRA|nr:Major Facilitator Superfamily (MFS) [Thraustotheca clavata]
MHRINPKRAKLIYGESPHQFPEGNVILFLHEDLIQSSAQEVLAFQHPQEYYRESELDDTELFYFLRVKYLQLADCLFSAMDLYLFAPNTNNIANDDINRANRMVSCNPIFSVRLAWPVLSDIIIRVFYLNPASGRKVIFLISLSLQLWIALNLNSVIEDQNDDFFKGLVWTLTFVYGGGFGTIPCLLCDMYGANNIGPLHGIILTSWAIAGVGGGLGFTSIFDNALKHNIIADAYSAATLIFIVVISTGLVVLFLVRTNPVDRFAPGYQYSIGRFWLCHFKRPSIEDYLGITN